jgi:hypothetical protein
MTRTTFTTSWPAGARGAAGWSLRWDVGCPTARQSNRGRPGRGRTVRCVCPGVRPCRATSAAEALRKVVTMTISVTAPKSPASRIPGRGSARGPGDLHDARKPTSRPTTVKDGSDDCCWGQSVTVARVDRQSWKEGGGRISRSGGRGGPTGPRRIRGPGRHEAREAGRRARGRPSRTRPGQRGRTGASGPGAGGSRREPPA